MIDPLSNAIPAHAKLYLDWHMSIYIHEDKIVGFGIRVATLS